MLATIALFAQVVATPLPGPVEARSVRLWLGPSPVAPGAAVPLYVAAAHDGYLLVVRVATDGRVEVVFPADPRTDGRVARGNYTLRAPGGRPALVVTEGRGTGLVLAALSQTPFRSSAFSRAGRWDQGLLVSSYEGADGLTDIAQRMLGDGGFDSDFALYTVRTSAPRSTVLPEPRALAQGQTGEPAPPIAVCTGCTIVYQTGSPTREVERAVGERAGVPPVVIVASVCELGAGGCAPSGFQHRPRRHEPAVKTAGICQIGIDCPPGAGAPAKAARSIRILPRRP